MSTSDNQQAGFSTSDAKKAVALSVFVETFDVYVRGVMEIAAELGLRDELTVEGLMAYWLSLPEADNLVRDFIRGDLTMFSLAEQTRQMVEADLGRLEIEAPHLLPQATSSTRLGKKLDAMRRAEAGARVGDAAPSDLEVFTRNNSEILKQVAGSTHETLVMWVMLYLMHATKARERGHRVASEFIKKNPGLEKRIRSLAAEQVCAAQAASPRPNRGNEIGPSGIRP
jgi:hypothetical protein